MLKPQRLSEVGQLLTGLGEAQKRALLDFIQDATEEAVGHAVDLQAPVENRERLAGGAGVLRDFQRDMVDLTNGDYRRWKEVQEWRETRQSQGGGESEDDDEAATLTTRVK